MGLKALGPLTMDSKTVAQKKPLFFICCLSQFFFFLNSGGVAQVVECLPSKCEVLSSNPNTGKKENKPKEKTKTPKLVKN
jgi:hypothetical protein